MRIPPADAEGKNFEDVMGGEDANISFTPKHAEMFQTPSVIDYTDQWIGSRKSSIQKMDMEKLVVQIAGAAKSWGMAGQERSGWTCHCKPTWRTKNSTSTGRGVS